MQGPRSKRFLSLKDRLALYAEEVRKKAADLPPGAERELLLKKANQAASASAVNDRPDAQTPHPPLMSKT